MTNKIKQDRAAKHHEQHLITQALPQLKRLSESVLEAICDDDWDHVREYLGELVMQSQHTLDLALFVQCPNLPTEADVIETVAFNVDDMDTYNQWAKEHEQQA